MYNCPEFIISYFGILKLGGIVVPLNNMLKREEARFIVEDSGAKIIISSPDKIEDSLNILMRVPTLKRVVSFSFNQKEFPQVKNLYEYREKDTEKPLSFSDVEYSSEDIAQIIYTSGTTGRPKGVCLSHQNLISNIKDCAGVIEASPRDNFVCFLPLFHSFASTVCMLLPLYIGSSTLLFRTITPFKRIIRGVRKNKVKIFVGIPSVYNILKEIKLPWFLRGFIIRFFHPLRLCISGAAALPEEVLKKFEAKFRVPLLEGYGLTEASPVVSLNPLRGKRIPGSVGKPLPSVKVKIVDKNGRELQRGQPGEILVSGPNIMKGYFNLESETSRVLKEGWLHTGDLGYIDKEGYLYITGRLKEMINVRGLNVYPREIEDVLYRLKEIKEAAVVGVNHPRKGEVPAGFVVLKEGSTLTSGQVQNFL